jgi:hypothetical protein
MWLDDARPRGGADRRALRLALLSRELRRAQNAHRLRRLSPRFATAARCHQPMRDATHRISRCDHGCRVRVSNFVSRRPVSQPQAQRGILLVEARSRGGVGRRALRISLIRHELRKPDCAQPLAPPPAAFRHVESVSPAHARRHTARIEARS